MVKQGVVCKRCWLEIGCDNQVLEIGRDNHSTNRHMPPYHLVEEKMGIFLMPACCRTEAEHKAMAMLCYVVLRYVLQCYVLLCYVI